MLFEDFIFKSRRGSVKFWSVYRLVNKKVKRQGVKQKEKHSSFDECFLMDAATSIHLRKQICRNKLATVNNKAQKGLLVKIRL